jgi:hypothetical protein
MRSGPPSSECNAVARWGDHLYVQTYSRPWWAGWRRVYWMRCWHCDLRVMDPCLSDV